MATLFFPGNQVAFFSGIDDDGNEVEVQIENAPFLATDTVEIEIRDGDILPNGEFDPNEVQFSRVTVIRDGVRYDLEVDSGSKIKESGGGGNKEQGDTFFTTNDEVGPAASGPFSNLESGKLIFSTTDTFETGDEVEITRETPGGNGNFEVGPSAVCYASGTLILTDRGEVEVQTLKPGDRLVTADRGPCRIRWIGRTDHRWEPEPHRQKPIEITPGALGEGLPRRKLIVSPQHHMLFRGPLVQSLFDETEVLALAKALVGLQGVRAMNGKRHITYFSLLCDRHEVIQAEGACSETFYPGPTALKMISPGLRREVEELFPALKSDPETGYGAKARRTLDKKETEALVRALRAHGLDREDENVVCGQSETQSREQGAGIVQERSPESVPMARLQVVM